MVSFNDFLECLTFGYGYGFLGIILYRNGGGYCGSVIKGCGDGGSARFKRSYLNGIARYCCGFRSSRRLCTARLRRGGAVGNKFNNIGSFGNSPSSNNALGERNFRGLAHGNLDFPLAAVLVFDCGSGRSDGSTCVYSAVLVKSALDNKIRTGIIVTVLHSCAYNAHDHADLFCNFGLGVLSGRIAPDAEHRTR